MKLPPGAVKAPMPKVVSPMLATLAQKPFSGDGWLFEPKWDGYRGLCFLRKGQVRFDSRKAIDLTFRFPELASVAESLKVENAVIDGEIVALDSTDVPRFQSLQGRFGFEGTPREAGEGTVLVYYAF